MSQVGFLEEDNRIFALELQSMQKTHQNLVGLGSFGRAILKASVSEDHVRPDHPLGQVIVERNFRDLEKSQEVEPVSEEAFGETPQTFIPIFPAGPEKEALLQEFDPPLVDPSPQLRTNLLQSQGIPEDTFQDLVIFQKGLRLIFEIKLAYLSEEMNEAFLFLPREPVVSRIEVRDEDTPVVFGENRFGDLGASRLGNPVISESFVDNRPEPMASAAHFPPGFVHVKVRALTNRFENLTDFDPEPLAHPLEGLGQGPFRDLEMGQAPEELLDLIKRETVVILQDHGLNEDMGTQVPVRDLLGGIRGRDHFLTMRAVVTVFLEQSDLGISRNEIFLGVLDHFLRPAQPVVTIGAVVKGLFDHPVNRLGFRPGQALMSGFLPRRFGALRMLGKPESFEKFLSGFTFFFSSQRLLELLVFLIQFEEFFNELLPGLPEPEDFFNQLFFGFLGEEELAVCFHNPNNGQEGDFFEGIPSGG